MNQSKTTESILRELIRRKGTDYLRSEQQFVSAIADLVEAKEDAQLLRHLAEAGGVSPLLDADGQSPAMRQSIYSRTLDTLCAQAPISPEDAQRACAIFWRAVYNEEPPVTLPVSSGAAPGAGSGKARQFQWKKYGLLLTLVIAAVCFAMFSVKGQSRPASITPPSSRSPRMNLDPFHLDKSAEEMLQAGTEDTYTYPDGSYMEFYHDDAGKEIYRLYFDAEESLTYLFAARYDSQGRLTQHQSFDGAGSLLRTDSYDFDSSGNTAKRRVTLGSGESFQGTSTFDEEGNETFTLPGTDGSESVYRYSKDGLRYSQDKYDSQGELVYDPRFSTGSFGEKVMSRENTAVGIDNGHTSLFVQGICSGPLIEYSVSKSMGSIIIYDSMGKQMEHLDYGCKDGKVENFSIHELCVHEVYNYDPQGNYVGQTQTHYSNGSIIAQSEYNDAGEEVKRIYYYENGNIWGVEEYNDQGEIIKDIWYNEDGTIRE